LTTICAFGAVTASFIFLTDLARLNGWPQWAALLLPLCIDALGGMALLQYRTLHIKVAGWVATGAITASFIGNGLSHLYATDVMTPGFISIALIGGVPALSLGLCVHLSTRKDTIDGTELLAVAAMPGTVPASGDAGDAATGGPGRTASRPSRSQTHRPAPARRNGDGTRRGSPNGPTVDELVAIIHRDGLTSERQVMAHGVGTTKATKALKLASNGHG
jgi:hypothetical protein